MSFRKTFLKNIFVIGGFTYLSQLINFFASFVTSRLLLPSDFGLVGLITVFSGFVTVFSDSGLTMAVIRSDYQNTYYRGLNAVSIIIGVILCAITLLLIYPISLFYKNAEIIAPGIAIAFLFILRSTYIVPQAILQKKLQFAAVGKIIFYVTVITTFSTIAFAYFGFKYWSLVWSQYINAILSYILFHKQTAIKTFVARKAVVIKSFKLARKLIGSLMGFNAINYWARNSDNLIVGKFYGTNDLGIYNRAYMMLQLPLNLITGLFNSVLFPSLIKHKNEGSSVEREYYFILKIISLINIPIAFILILFPYKFTTILWGNNWAAVANLLPYFGLLVLTQTLTSTVGNLMVIENYERAMMFTGWLNALFIIAGIIYGATISLTAIAAFTALAYLLLVLPMNIFFMLGYKLKFNSGLFFWLPKLLLASVMWCGLYFSLPNLVVAGFVCWVLMVLWDVRKDLFKVYELIHLKSLQRFSRHA